MTARPLALAIIFAMVASAGVLAPLVFWQISRGAAERKRAERPRPVPAVIGVLVTLVAGGALFATAVALGDGEGADSVVPLVVGALAAIGGVAVFLPLWDRTHDAPKREGDAAVRWLPLVVFPAAVVVLVLGSLVVKTSEAIVVLVAVLAIVTGGTVLLARSERLSGQDRARLAAALWCGMALAVAVFTILDAALEDDVAAETTAATQPPDDAPDPTPEPGPVPEPEEPVEPEPAELVFGDPAIEVAATRATLAAADEPLPVDPGSLGIADPSATAFITDGLVVFELGAGLWEAAQCVGAVNPLAEPQPTAVLAGPGCPAPETTPRLTGAQTPEEVLVSEDGTFVAFQTRLSVPLDAIGVLIPVTGAEGLALLENTIGLSDVPPAGSTDVPPLEIGERVVLSAPGRSFDGVELQAQ